MVHLGSNYSGVGESRSGVGDWDGNEAEEVDVATAEEVNVRFGQDANYCVLQARPETFVSTATPLDFCRTMFDECIGVATMAVALTQCSFWGRMVTL